jgi:SpoVK/Ycf46/Vps4 family AAA+-type ATPase
MSKRINQLFKGMGEHRQFIATGRCVGDVFCVDFATGAERLEKALMVEAQKRSLQMILSLNREGTFTFSTSEMEETFQAITQGRSRDPKRKKGSRSRSLPEISSGGSSSEDEEKIKRTREKAINTMAPIEGGLEPAVGVLRRLIDEYNEPLLIILPDLERLITPEVPLDPQIQRLLTDMGELLASGRGDPRAMMVVSASEDRKKVLKRWLQDHDAGASPWKEIELKEPALVEIEEWLSRYQARQGLIGDASNAAKQLYRRGSSLSVIANLFRYKVAEGETDIASIVMAGYNGVKVGEALAEIEQMVGMSELKSKLREITREAAQNQQALRRGETLALRGFHIALHGRPGTGKSQVAKRIAKLFSAAGIVRRDNLNQVALKDLAGEYNSFEMIKSVERLFDEASGGVIFIDEAYQLADSEWGRSAITTLTDEMDRRRGDVSVILAGYQDKMSNLYQANEGLKSRIEPNIFNLPDYTPDELCMIFDLMIAEDGVPVSTQARMEAHRIIKREAQRPHGNGRGVRNLIDVWRSCRLGREGIAYEFEDITDVRQPNNSRNPEEIIERYQEKFLNMTQVVQKMRSLMLSGLDSLKRGHLDRAPRFTFTGPPGTGKTETARYFAELLNSVGTLKSSSIKQVSLQDFTGNFKGDSQVKTKALFEAAQESVLFIDEAYRLGESEDGREALSQIVDYLTRPEYDNVSVIFAGYTDEMNELFKVNSGLKSRVQHEIQFLMPPTEVLVEITLRALADHYGLKIHQDFEAQVQQSISAWFNQQRLNSNFGSARSAHELAKKIRESALNRGAELIEVEDIPRDERVIDIEEIEASFSRHFIGQEALLDQTKMIIGELKRRESSPADLSLGICLMGHPGTGKSSFARWLLETFSNLRRAQLPSVEVGAQELIGEYIGQAPQNISRLFERGRGGLIFIDEFHSLLEERGGRTGADAFGRQALKQLVAEMQKPANRQTVVVLAGYPDELMNTLKRGDQGLLRRFPIRNRILIEPPTLETLSEVTLKNLREGCGLEPEVHPSIVAPYLIEMLETMKAKDDESFGHFSAAIDLADEIERTIFSKNSYQSRPITISDIVEMALQ